MRPKGALLAALLIVVHSNAHAKDEKPPRSFSTTWLIESASLPQGKQTAKEGELLIKQRLLPEAIVTLTNDYTSANPEETVAKGAQLILAGGAEAPVFCSTRYKRPGTLSRLLSTGPETGTQRCFVDSDNDGTFDQTFAGFNNLQLLPGVFGRLPKTPIIITPLAYAKADVSEFSEKYFVGLQYIQRGGLARNKRQFRIVYGAKEPWGSFTFDQTPSIKDRDFPKTINNMGATVTILSGDRESVTYQVDRMMPAQPFGVVVQTIYY